MLVRKFFIAFTSLMFQKNITFQMSCLILVIIIAYAMQVRERACARACVLRVLPRKPGVRSLRHRSRVCVCVCVCVCVRARVRR